MTKTYFAVLTNTDLTEGRGQQYALCLTVNYTTALRVGKGKGVMGTDCSVATVEPKMIGGTPYVPIGLLKIVYPEDEDLKAEEHRRRYQEAVAKASAAGLTEEDIRLLTERPT